MNDGSHVALRKRHVKTMRRDVYELCLPDGWKSTPFVIKQDALIWAKERGYTVTDETEE